MIEEATCKTSSVQLLQMLGNIQMKARHWRDAIFSFRRCLADAVSIRLVFNINTYTVSQLLFSRPTFCVFHLLGQDPHCCTCGGIFGRIDGG